jgi:hypothetical protein
VTPQWGIFRSCGPAGLIHMTATELLAFARLHLAAGVTADGTRVLSDDSVRAMLERQVAVPDPWTLGSHWGLGWILMEWGGAPVYGHDGATLGQGGFLRIAPGSDLSVALLCNGGRMRELFQDLYTEIFGEVGGIAVPPAPEPTGDVPSFDATQYVGRYAREGVSMEVADGEDGLSLTVTSTGALAEAMAREPQVLQLVPFRPDVFLARMPGAQAWTPAVFFRLDDGSRYLHLGARSTPLRG